MSIYLFKISKDISIIWRRPCHNLTNSTKGHHCVYNLTISSIKGN